jgi:hypothetical protein
MIRVKQHVPNFVDVDECEYYQGEDTQSLLSDPRLLQRTKDHPVFCKTDNSYWSFEQGREIHQELLMAESTDGRKWFVLGYVIEGTMDLPQARMVG